MGRRPSVNTNLPPRMRARRQRSGEVYYYYDSGGVPRREIPLGPDYTIAVRKWAELHAAEIPAGSSPTLKDVWDSYLAKVWPGKSAGTQKDYSKSIRHILRFFMDPPAPLDAIEPVHIRQYLDWRGQQAKTRANRERALISLLWNHARAWGYTEKPNPCAGIHGFKEKRRTAYITDQVYDAVYQHADQPLRDMLDLAYLTGQRPGDVISIYETDIQDGRLQIDQSKTDKRLKIKVTGQLKTVIDRIKARKESFKVRSLALIVDEHGKPLSQRAIWQRFQKAKSAATEQHPKLRDQIEKYQLRDLRAKAGTDKAVKTKDMRAAQKILGHASVVMTERYVREINGDEVDPTQ